MNELNYSIEVDKLWKELELKREFGLTKYGVHSFQNSLENLNKCDLLQHIEEELIDTINYSLAKIIKLRKMKCIEKLENDKNKIYPRVHNGYDKIDNIKLNIEYNEIEKESKYEIDDRR